MLVIEWTLGTVPFNPCSLLLLILEDLCTLLKCVSFVSECKWESIVILTTNSTSLWAGGGYFGNEAHGCTTRFLDSDLLASFSFVSL